MVAEQQIAPGTRGLGCSLAKISMVAEHDELKFVPKTRCSLAKISMVAEHTNASNREKPSCSLAKISMVAELDYDDGEKGTLL